MAAADGLYREAAPLAAEIGFEFGVLYALGFRWPTWCAGPARRRRGWRSRVSVKPWLVDCPTRCTSRMRWWRVARLWACWRGGTRR